MKRALALSGLVALGLGAATGTAAADASPSTRDDVQLVVGSGHGNLRPLNNSGASGTANVSVHANQVTVSIRSRGLSPSLPHAQHLHIGGRGECPRASADTNGDRLIDTVEGQPSYGEVRVSLTTSGDVGPGSALAVDRFPVADANGTIDYRRTFPLPAGVTANEARNAVVVQHGISKLFADGTAYDGAPRSSLDASLPLEATIPSTCGQLGNQGLLNQLLDVLRLGGANGGARANDGLLGLGGANGGARANDGLLGLGGLIGSDAVDDRSAVRIGINLGS